MQGVTETSKKKFHPIQSNEPLHGSLSTWDHEVLALYRSKWRPPPCSKTLCGTLPGSPCCWRPTASRSCPCERRPHWTLNSALRSASSRWLQGKFLSRLVVVEWLIVIILNPLSSWIFDWWMLIGYDKYCGIVIVLLILADTTITWICKAVRHKSLNGQSSVPTHCCRPAKIDYQIKHYVMYFFLSNQARIQT